MEIDNDVYNRMSDSWWDDHSFLTLLRTGLNEGRFGYFREVLTQKLGLEPASLRALDIGCGGGLLAEEFAKLGCRVTGIDPSEASLEVARAHARTSGLDITYQQGTGEKLPFESSSFDLVYCCDVLEHVRDLDLVIAEVARVLRPGGVFCFDTINRTLVSWLIEIWVLQRWSMTRVMPTNVHEWRMFIKPAELRAALARNGLEQRDQVGLKPRAPVWQLFQALRLAKRGEISLAEAGRRLDMGLSSDTREVYMGYAVPGGTDGGVT